MSKAIYGAALIAGGVVLGIATGALAAITMGITTPLFAATLPYVTALLAGGISMEAGAIASALTSNRGMGITTRQPAANRQIIYGEQRVGGVMIYNSTTGGHLNQNNMIIVLAGHEIDSITGLYLDGRLVYWQNRSAGYTTHGGVDFGGSADLNDHIGPGGAHYNFGTLVFAEARYGDQALGDVIPSITANDPTWAADGHGNAPSCQGCAYLYLKIESDAAMFPQLPEIKISVRGKNNIFDPRTGTSGYSTNWALIVADVLTDTQFGLGDDSVNQDQLIIAANVCDEQVALALGATESRYCCHYHYDTSMGPGDVLQTMMPAAAGRLSRIGGEWYLWPAYWQGPSFSFDYTSLTGPPTWKPNRSLRDLFNEVRGTYIAANYPYNVAGNLYDSNGWYDGTISNTFPFAFQPTSYPAYSADPLHGYTADEYLADDGRKLVRELTQSCCLSISQAQRCAKIYLLRNRQQGSGTLDMHLAAWSMQPVDVMQFTFPALGWTDKVLEIVSVGFRTEKDDNDIPTLRASFGVQETASTVYDWSTTEELSVYDVPANPAQSTYTPAAPTNLTLTSSAATAIQAADGTVTPRISATWDVPLDVQTKLIQIRYQEVVGGVSGPWLDAPSVDATQTQAYIVGVIAGHEYNVQIRGVRTSTGAVSAWDEVDGFTVTLTLSVLSNTGIGIGTLSANAFSDGTAHIICRSFVGRVGPTTVTVLPSGYTITGLAQATRYSVYYIDPTFAGGAVTPIATTNPDDFLGKVGYWLIDSIVTPVYVSGGGSRYAPITFSDSGSSSTSNASNAFDGDSSSNATVESTASVLMGGTTMSTVGLCEYSGFPSVMSTSGQFVQVTAAIEVTLSGSGDGTAIIEAFASGVSLGQCFSTSSPVSKSTAGVAVPLGILLSTITVRVTSAADAPNSADGTSDIEIDVYEIYIQ